MTLAVESAHVVWSHIRVLLVDVCGWSGTPELVPNTPSVGLVCEPNPDIVDFSTSVGVAHLGISEGLATLQFPEWGCNARLPCGRPEYSSMAGDTAKEGEGNQEKEHLDC